MSFANINSIIVFLLLVIGSKLKLYYYQWKVIPIVFPIIIFERKIYQWFLDSMSTPPDL